MIVCRGFSKSGARIVRHRRSVHLKASLHELIDLYDRAGGPVAEVSGLVDREIERCLEDRQGDKERAQLRLHALFRTRDLHRYLLEEPGLIPLKLHAFEHLLFHQTPHERWAAIREALLDHLDLLCRTPLPGLPLHLEAYKQALSDRSSALGKMLTLTALFNFDLDEEPPPPNLILKFRRGAFPLHYWEISSEGGPASPSGMPEGWNPASPWSRWEYLAADLMHAIVRRAQRQGAAARIAQGRTGRTPPPAAEPDSGGSTVYCRLEVPESGGDPGQMELFPFDPQRFLPELIRLIHRRHGPEAVKLFALLCRHFDALQQAEAAELPLAEITVGAAFSDLSARGMRTRLNRLERVIEQLGRIELTRVFQRGSGATAHSSRLVTELERADVWPPPVKDSDPPLSLPASEPPLRLRVRLDPLFHEAGLGTPFRDFPEVLLATAGKEHPYLIALYAFLRTHWSHPSPDLPPPIERTAGQLMAEAGLWVSESGRYRALEALKRDLSILREQGCLGGWRMQRGAIRDGLEDRYRLLPPSLPQGALRPAGLEGGNRIGDSPITGVG